MNLKNTLLAVALAGLPVISNANESEEKGFFEFDRLTNFNYDKVEVDASLHKKSAQAAIYKSFHSNAFAGVNIDTNFEGRDILGLSMNFAAPITNWADITGGFSYKSTLQSGNKDSGWSVNVGIKQWLSMQVELGAKLEIDYFDDSNVYGDVYARFHATQNFSIGAKLAHSDLSNTALYVTTEFAY
ncbi:hypothetical protein [Vibrio barjaei]|uniref:hypothetical protein n=1 Tax=Vibrio barjaei TaxID=1676683 RepID=UPI002284BA76|nr:hypothetical protein [Vibrio barjaei]MCY9872335.1 hypothetical protein [Vibrio barjaei]